MYYTAFEKLKEGDEMFVDKTLAWTVSSDVKKKGAELFVEQTVTKRGFQAIRCFSYSNHDPLTAYRAYIDEETRKAYDRNVAEVKAKEMIGSNLVIGY